MTILYQVCITSRSKGYTRPFKSMYCKKEAIFICSKIHDYVSKQAKDHLISSDAVADMIVEIKVITGLQDTQTIDMGTPAHA